MGRGSIDWRCSFLKNLFSKGIEVLGGDAISPEERVKNETGREPKIQSDQGTLVLSGRGWGSAKATRQRTDGGRKEEKT